MQGRIFEAGYHVTYKCVEGHKVGGISIFKGKQFATIICGDDGTWNWKANEIPCERQCGLGVQLLVCMKAKS